MVWLMVERLRSRGLLLLERVEQPSVSQVLSEGVSQAISLSICNDPYDSDAVHRKKGGIINGQEG